MFNSLQLEKEQTRALAADNATLKAASEPSRSGPAVRGKATRRKTKATATRRQQHAEAVVDQSDHSDALKKARSAVQAFVTQSFRDVSGVSKKDQWPDPTEIRVNEITGQQYLAPVFTADVNDSQNQRVCTAVGEQAFNDLKHRGNRPQAARVVNGKWTQDLIQDMARNSFRNLKTDWKKQVDQAAKERDDIKKCTNRWLQRRVTKLDQIKKAVDEYAVKNGLDPVTISGLLCEEHMSDEASGPDSEDDTYESHAAWKRDMARLGDFTDVSRDALDKLKFLEVLICDWRSDAMSHLVQGLHALWFDKLTQSQKAALVFVRVRNSDRHGRRIPALAPSDFGTSFQWLDNARNEPENIELLRNWGTYGNPPGLEAFGAANVSDTPDAEAD
ncbi:hypothetical protein B0H10DRAFT_1991128 [Mycena sp. CBHHK59/15]|nr:hypothetical protein B0H10DRAFT_1991128 [Mycena sp. CBHHK59/15]